MLVAPLRLRLWREKIREPDLLFLADANDPRRQDAYWTGADLVIEVVSRDDPQRDLVTKRSEYAQAGIPEYWIVDPQTATITVLRLAAPPMLSTASLPAVRSPLLPTTLISRRR